MLVRIVERDIMYVIAISAKNVIKTTEKTNHISPSTQHVGQARHTARLAGK